MKFVEINAAIAAKIIILENTKKHIDFEISRLESESGFISVAIEDLNTACKNIKDIAKSVGD